MITSAVDKLTAKMKAALRLYVIFESASHVAGENRAKIAYCQINFCVVKYNKNITAARRTGGIHGNHFGIDNEKKRKKIQAPACSAGNAGQNFAGRHFCSYGEKHAKPHNYCHKKRRVRKQLQKVNAEIGGMPEGFDPFFGAPLVLLVVAKKYPNCVYDGSCVISNLMNAAWSLGVASCWVHRAKEEMQTDFGRQLMQNSA